MHAVCFLQEALDGTDMGFEFCFVAVAGMHEVEWQFAVGEVHIDFVLRVRACGGGRGGAVRGRVFDASVTAGEFGMGAMGRARGARGCGRAVKVDGRVDVLFEAAVGGWVDGVGAAVD